MKFVTFIICFAAIGSIIGIGLLIYLTINLAHENVLNNAAPIVTVAAKVTCMRMDCCSGSYSFNGMPQFFDNTTYYATFQLENNERHEFEPSGCEYSQLAEGDTGKLTYQRNRYHNFVRNK